LTQRLRSAPGERDVRSGCDLQQGIHHPATHGIRKRTPVLHQSRGKPLRQRKALRQRRLLQRANHCPHRRFQLLRREVPDGMAGEFTRPLPGKGRALQMTEQKRRRHGRRHRDRHIRDVRVHAGPHRPPSGEVHIRGPRELRLQGETQGVDEFGVARRHPR
ncbi:MAG: hypothetical protein ACK55I_43550, partial [bacterium]